VLDTLAGELLEKETLHRPELQAIFADVEKRPRLTMFDDFGGRIPSDKPPIKTPGELAIERGEPWPPPVAEPAFKAAIAAATQAAAAAQADADRTGHGANGSHGGQGNRQGAPHGPTQPDYGAPAGWHAPGWPPPQQQQPGSWYPPAQPPQQPSWPQPAPSYPGQQGPQAQGGHAQPTYPPYPPYPPPGQSNPYATKSPDKEDDDVSRSNPPAHG
jgi:cell division protease FtsH